MSDDLTVRPLTFDDGAASRRLGQEAFGVPTTPPPDPDPGSWPGAGEHPVGAFDGDILAGRVIGREYHSWFGGAEVPTWGIAGVTVAAEYRGRQALTPLFTASFRQAREWGAALSTLFPTAPGIYRRFGYEVVADYVDVAIRTDALTRVRGDALPVRRATVADVDAIHRVYQRWASAQNGPLTRTGPSFTATAEELLGSFTGVSVAVDGGEVVGFASWERGQGYDEAAHIDVSDLIGLTPAATRGLLRMLGSFASVTGTVRVSTSGADHALLSVPAQPWRAIEHHDYMLRVLDPVLAIEARRYSSLLAGEIAFEVVDAFVPECSGGYRVRFADGRATCTRTDGVAAAPTFTERGLAAWYAGAQSVANLRLGGQVTGGDPARDADLDAVFAGRETHIRDYF